MAKKDYSNWSKDELIKRVNGLEKRKKFGLVWEDEPEEVVEINSKNLIKKVEGIYGIL
jgi:hypothetical protein